MSNSKIRNFSRKSRRSGKSVGNAFLSKISIPSFSLSILKLEEKYNHVLQIIICFTDYNRRKEKKLDWTFRKTDKSQHLTSSESLIIF
jgi:hypothetical protein